MKKIIIAALFLVSMAASYYYGLVSHRDRLAPYPQLLGVRDHLFPGIIGFRDASKRIEVPCDGLRGARTMVALAFGQSNSGNHGETMYRPAKPVFNFYRGRCYRAEDPLLGSTGDRGSVWTRLADLVIAAGLYDRVVIIPIGVGSTTIAEWAPGGYLHQLITGAIDESRSRGLAITHLFWVQGGSEKNTAGDAANRERYRKDFMAMLASIRGRGVSAPIYVALATYGHIGINKDIEDAQRGLVDPAKKIFAGADNDVLYRDEANTWEGVHLSHRGLELCSMAWLEKIRKAEGR